MSGSYEIYIAAAVTLKFEHRLGQLLNCHLVSAAVMADIKILTKNTAQVAASKEYSARAAGADKYAFLAEMRPYRTDYRHISNAAKPNLALAAIDLAVTWTKCARIHPLPQLPNSFAKRIKVDRRCHLYNFIELSPYRRQLNNP